MIKDGIVTISSTTNQPTNTAHLFALAKELESEGDVVVHLELGDPEFGTPEQIKQTVQNELTQNNTKYETAQGIPELRSSIASYYKEKFDVFINPKNEVIVTTGAKLGINLTLRSILKIEDEVIILSPSWPTYKGIVKSLGAVVKEVNLSFDEQKDIKHIEDAITSKTKCILINFPNNPTSMAVRFSFLKQINELLIRNPSIYLLSDEIYMELAYEEYNTSMIPFYPTNKKILIISGFSKAWAMTGFRLGYVIAEESIISEVKELINHTTSCVPPFIQKAGITALNCKGHFGQTRKNYRTRQLKVIDLLKQSEYVRIPFIPNAAFYIFIEIVTKSENFVIDLLYTHHICVTPGSVFGASYKNFIRISLTESDVVVMKSIKTILQFLKESNI